MSLVRGRLTYRLSMNDAVLSNHVEWGIVPQGARCNMRDYVCYLASFPAPGSQAAVAFRLHFHLIENGSI